MTREEAIFAMEYYKLHFATEKGAEAFDMAIKALSSSEIPNKSENPNTCGDAISRQEALNAITMAEVRWQAVDNVNKLPSVTPKCEVLDKIRAEIDSYYSDNRDRNCGLYIAMKIIDKYKAESEVQG